MSYHWNPTKKKIEGWLDKRIHEFAAQENKNPLLLKEQWLDSYLYIEIHEIFFTSFPTELYKWIVKIADNQGRWKLDGPIMWAPELVRRLEESEDKITHTFNHWLDRIVGGFVTEFAVDTSFSYNEAERRFLKGS